MKHIIFIYDDDTKMYERLYIRKEPIKNSSMLKILLNFISNAFEMSYKL